MPCCKCFTAQHSQSIDASIHTAYIELIRGAKRYLYLENQYFLGSSHLWDADQDTPCSNQVPAEIALKICSKIKVRGLEGRGWRGGGS
jgi:phospholipase D1/2